jgi:rod shape determining protein RodA
MSKHTLHPRNFFAQLFHERNNPSRPSPMRLLHLDPPLLIGLLCIIFTGMIVLFSAAGEDFMVVFRQALRFLMACGVMVLIAQIHPNQFKKWAPWFFGVTTFLLIIVLLIGYTGKGATRWLNLGIVRFQPSELMKLAMPMMLAWYFSDRPMPPTKTHLFLGTLIMFIPVGLIAKQPDLGTAIMVATAGAGVILFSGIRWRFIILVLLAVAALTPIAWHFMHDYQRGRVLTFLNPELDPLGAGYHIIQSKIAIGSGGFFGKGWMQGTQTQLDFLPEHATDFIYAVLGEEFGLMGGLILLSFYTFVCYRCLRIAYEAQENFTRLLASSLGFTFFVSVFINIGMVCGIFPVVGLPLPLLSYGGTSVMTLMAGFGILMSISTHRKLVST